MSQLALFLQLYIRPMRGFSRALDEGKFLFAILVALGVMLAMQVPRSSAYQAHRIAAAGSAMTDRMMREAKQITANGGS